MKWNILSSCTLALLMVASASAATVTITGDTAAGENQPGWLFNRDASTSTPFVFNTDQASIGTGSLYVLPIGTNASNKFVGEYYPGTTMANFTNFSYDFRIGPNGSNTSAGQFYLNVYANFGVSNDTKFYDCRYNVVPTIGSTTAWTTVAFDPTQAYAVTTRGSSPYACPAVPADMDLFSAGSNIRAFALNMGDTSNSDVGLDGYFDNVVVSTTAGTTVFDFEPVVVAPATKAEVLAAKGVPGKGIANAPGLQKPATAGFAGSE